MLPNTGIDLIPFQLVMGMSMNNLKKIVILLRPDNTYLLKLELPLYNSTAFNFDV